MDIDFPKKRICLVLIHIVLQYNGITQLLTTATRSTLASKTLIVHGFHNHFFDNPECGILDVGLGDHSANLVKFRFSCNNFDGTEPTYKVLFSHL